jgi:hypothetical protein
LFKAHCFEKTGRMEEGMGYGKSVVLIIQTNFGIRFPMKMEKKGASGLLLQ